MNAVFQIEVGAARSTFEQKRNQGDFVFRGNRGIDLLKSGDVIRAEVSWESHARKNHRSAALLERSRHLIEIRLHRVYRNTPQPIVAAELEDDDRRMHVESALQTRQSPARCIATDARVNGAVCVSAASQLGLQHLRVS